MNLPVATIKAVDETEALAQVSLDGYRAVTQPRQWGQSRLARLIWKFKLIEGDKNRLQLLTLNGQPVLLCTAKGKEVLVNITESPTDKQCFGLLEYIM